MEEGREEGWEKSHRASGAGNMGDNKERKELSQRYTYTYVSTHTYT